MGSKKVIAIAFSDMHANKWKQYNEGNRRLNLIPQMLETISDECLKHGVPALFAGDIAHNDTFLHNEVIHKLYTGINEFFEQRKILFLAISGNHDQCERNNYKSPSPSYLHTLAEIFPSFKCMDYSYLQTKNFMVMGIPYNNGNADYKKFLKQFREVKTNKPKILLLHTDMPDCRDTTGIVLESYENIPRNIGKFFEGFDLVLCGHIHKAQQLHPRVYMLGANNQQRTSDMGNSMGYWRVYNDMTMEFVDSHLPEFKYENDPGLDQLDYKVKVVEVKEEKVAQRKKSKTYTSNDGVKLAKRYLKDKDIKDKNKRVALFKSIK